MLGIDVRDEPHSKMLLQEVSRSREVLRVRRSQALSIMDRGDANEKGGAVAVIDTNPGI